MFQPLGASGRGVTSAIVGTGNWSAMALVPAQRCIDDITVVACVGQTIEKARDFAARLDIDGAYSSLEDLFSSNHKPDLLVVATPDDLHPEGVVAALENGSAVFCEKPLSNDVATALRLAELAEQSDSIDTIGYSFRYSPALQALREDIVTGYLGEPWLIELFEHNPQFHARSGKPMNWKGDPEHAGAGALFEYGSHIVDLANWLVGPIRRVSTSLSQVYPGSRLDDIATLQLKFDEPAIGILVAGWVLSGSFPGIRVRLHGSEGLAEAQLAQTIEGGESYRRIPSDGSTGERVAIEPLGESIFAYARRHFADVAALLLHRAPRYQTTMPTLLDGALAQGVLEASLQATDRWVSIDYKPENPIQT